MGKRRSAERGSAPSLQLIEAVEDVERGSRRSRPPGRKDRAIDAGSWPPPPIAEQIAWRRLQPLLRVLPQHDLLSIV
jgi:hypothetical protein